MTLNGETGTLFFHLNYPIYPVVVHTDLKLLHR